MKPSQAGANRANMEQIFPSFVHYHSLHRRGLTSLHIAAVYTGAVKSLARPRRKKATATEDFEFHISYLLS